MSDVQASRARPPSALRRATATSCQPWATLVLCRWRFSFTALRSFQLKQQA